MQSETVSSKSLIDWGVASRALPGQTVCGDLHLVQPVPFGVLLAVVDGLGHGDEATLAANTAVATLAEHSEETLDALVERCHETLTKTRGVVMTAATLRAADGQLTWLGVGNVEAARIRPGDETHAPAERVLLRSGIVGYRLPELHTSSQFVTPGDLLVFATDGINAGFTKNLPTSDTPQKIADTILERHFKGTDDALVLVVRYLGASHE
ncbi:MAG: stage II sporulation protein E (SpoIIE) [Verrucomicrobia bacterium]|nr:MAG: stage II sporulation protein E (SpoIIE) [Verrucomicrobiota bacterium]